MKGVYDSIVLVNKARIQLLEMFVDLPDSIRRFGMGVQIACHDWL